MWQLSHKLYHSKIIAAFPNAVSVKRQVCDTLRFLLGLCIYYPPFAKTRLRLRQFARWRKLAQTSLRKPRYRHFVTVFCCSAVLHFSTIYFSTTNLLKTPLNVIIVTVHSYLVPVTIYAPKCNIIAFGACKTRDFHAKSAWKHFAEYYPWKVTYNLLTHVFVVLTSE